MPVVLSIGTFDGVHRGHCFLLEQARSRADELGCALAIVSFDPCPAVVLRPRIGRYQISSAAQKLRRLEELRVSLAVMLTFDAGLSQISANQFMDALEARFSIREIWFGEDFHFGRNREGNLQMLVERGRVSGFSLHVVSRGMEEKESISSTRVRRVIAAGDVESATPLLGYTFERECLHGTAGLWFGTASPCVRCAVASHLLLPADGMYAVVSSAGDRTMAVVSSREPAEQLWVYGVAARPAFSVEFVARLCSVDDYAADPPAWHDRAMSVLDDWERPRYSPISHH